MTALLTGTPLAAASTPPPDLDVEIQAVAFEKGSVRALRRGSWADGPAMILCADRSPDWAEWSFSVGKAGVYRVLARFAAAASRPVSMQIDGIPVATSALAETTGSWKSSTARWFPVGLALLDAGKHILRIERPTCIPHIVAFGLQRDPDIDPSKGPLALPEDVWLRDGFRRQDWMIWTISGIEHFSVGDQAYRIVDGRHVFNRPMYGTHGAETVFAGDRPMLLFTRGPQTKLGNLRVELLSGETNKARRWLDECQQIEFCWNGAWARWTIPDLVPKKAPLHIAAVPLAGTAGFIVRIQAPPGLDLDLWYGGIRDGYADNRAGFGAMPLGNPAADTTDNRVTSVEAGMRLEHPGVPDGACTVVAVRPGGPDPTWRVEACAEGKGQVARAAIRSGTTPVYVIVVAGSGTLPDGWRTKPAALWDDSRKHYEAIADRLRVDTPAAILDAAVRSNNTAMDGEYRPPSFLHGALRWGTECGGWYLGWRGWYGPIMAGDWEQVRTAACMHFDHQFQTPANGLLSRGKVANFVSFSGTGSDTHTGYNMQEVFLDHLRMYLNWTGDLKTLLRLWPKIKMANEYERREIGRDLDGLYTNAVNTWISDGHHYNGCACTQASAYAVARERFAADLARAAGEDPSSFETQASRTVTQMNRRLWRTAKGIFTEYVDQDGVYHDAAEAPTIYHPIEMGVADPFQAYQMTRYVDERLWRFGDQILANDWFPVIVTNGLIGFNESLNTALAYYYAGRFERGWRLLKVCCESTARAAVPGSISCYGSKKGEQGSYIDFTDASSLLARTVVEGLFGLRPQVHRGRVEWHPGFPQDWDRASLRTRGFSLRFRREGNAVEMLLESDRELIHALRLPLTCAAIADVRVNGQAATPRIQTGVARPYLDIETGPTRRTLVHFRVSGTLPKVSVPAVLAKGDSLRIVPPADGRLLELFDPQGMVTDATLDPEKLLARGARDDGPHTMFVRLQCPLGTWWQPLDIRCTPPLELAEVRLAAIPGLAGLGLRLQAINRRRDSRSGSARIHLGPASWETPLTLAGGESKRLEFTLEKSVHLLPGHTEVTLEFGGHTIRKQVRLWRLFDAFPEQQAEFAAACRLLEFPRNEALGKVFRREYPKGQGPVLNNWTWYDPKIIDTDAMRTRVRNGRLTTSVGVPFAVKTEGKDTLLVSRWQPFPEKAVIPVGLRTDRLYLLLANHTSNNQTHLVQATITLMYADGSRQVVPLKGPHDIDGMLQHYSDMAPEWIGGKNEGWYGHGRASGVHADVTDIAVDPTRELRSFEVCCITRETLIGVLGATAHAAP